MRCRIRMRPLVEYGCVANGSAGVTFYFAASFLGDMIFFKQTLIVGKICMIVIRRRSILSAKSVNSTRDKILYIH